MTPPAGSPDAPTPRVLAHRGPVTRGWRGARRRRELLRGGRRRARRGCDVRRIRLPPDAQTASSCCSTTTTSIARRPAIPGGSPTSTSSELDDADGRARRPDHAHPGTRRLPDAAVQPRREGAGRRPVGRIVAQHADRVLLTSFSDARRRAALRCRAGRRERAARDLRRAAPRSRALLAAVALRSPRAAARRSADSTPSRSPSGRAALRVLTPRADRCGAPPRCRGARLDGQRPRRHAAAGRARRRRHRDRPRGPRPRRADDADAARYAPTLSIVCE